MPLAAARGWLLSWQPGQGRPPRLLQSEPFGALEPVLARSDAGHSVAFTGYLFDTSPGRARCHAQPARYIAAEYEQRGTRCFRDLSGGFVVVLWDARLDRLFLVRDGMGLVPCYFAERPDAVWIGPCPMALAGRRRPPYAVNRVLLAEWLLGHTNPRQAGESFFAGVRRLPPGSWRSFGTGGGRCRRYWDPLPPGFAWVDEEAAAGIGARLQTAVDRCLAAGADVLALSGGYDSLAIAALAAGGGAGEPLHALSLRFAGTPMDEGERQQWAACRLGLTQTLHHERGRAADVDFLQRVLGDAANQPMPALGLWQPLFTWMMEHARERGLCRMLFGTGGDELFAVDAALALDLLRGGRLGELARFVRAWQRSGTGDGLWIARALLWSAAARPLLRAAAARAFGRAGPSTPRPDQLSVPGLVPPGEIEDLLAARATGLPPAADRTALGHYVGALRHLVQSPRLMLEMDHRAAWAADYGISILYPFFDRDLVGLALRVAPWQLYHGGVMKAPLRALAAERLPGLCVTTPKVDFGTMAVQALRCSGERAWRSLGGAHSLAALGVVDAACAARIMRRFFERGTGSPQLVWRLLSAEAWLRAGPGA